MSPDTGNVYIMTGDGEGEWVRPTPAKTAIVDAVTAATDLTVDDLADVETYVDLAELAAALEEQTAYTAVVEGYDVTIQPSGEIAVTD